MSRYGEHGDPTPRCAYCGKPEIKVIWSGPRRHYCSHKCMSAGEYPITLICVLCVVPMAGLMTTGFLIGLLSDPFAIDSIYVFMVSFFDFFALFSMYTLYRGWQSSN
jgi:hypothetical protein